MYRNLTLTAQVFAWSLVVSLLVVLLCLFVFVCILLAGSGWISDGVRKGSEAVNSTLPEVRKRMALFPGLCPAFTPCTARA